MSPYIYGLRGSDCTAGDTGGGGYMKDMWGGYTEDIYLTRAESTNNGGGLSLNSGTYTVIRYECHFCKASEFVENEYTCGAGMSLGTAATLQLEDAVVADHLGCGILVLAGSQAIVRRSKFLRGQAILGGGLLVAGATATIYDSLFDLNYCDVGGGAFWAHLDSTSVTIVNSEVTRNRGLLMGSGLAVSVGAQVTMRGTRVHHNGADSGFVWGAIVVWNARLTIRDDCKIYRNKARYGGGIVVGQGSTLDAQGSYIGENEASMDGSQIYLGDGSWAIEDVANIPDEGLAATRFWPKWGCDTSGKGCLIGESGGPGESCSEAGCAPPVDSKFEATFGCMPETAAVGGCASNPSAPAQALGPDDWWDVSQVDGWTLPYKVEVVGECDCATKVIDCSRLKLSSCPTSEYLGKAYGNQSLLLTDPGSTATVGCYSPCAKLTYSQWGQGYTNTPESAAAQDYCCPTPPIEPAACSAGPIAATEFVAAVHKLCPSVYAYAYDDGVGLSKCPAGTRYDVTFYCPA